MVKTALVRYIETNIIPRYEKFDKAHNQNHVKCVIHNALSIAREFKVDNNLVYAAAAYHDLGLEVERQRHEIFSKEIMLSDGNLDRFFNEGEKKIIADAILTHRASSKIKPSSVYGKIVADADRDLIPAHIIERTILYSLEHFAEYDRVNHSIKCKEHIEEKYGEEGYLKLWLHSEMNQKRLMGIRKVLSDERKYNKLFDYYFNKQVGR